MTLDARTHATAIKAALSSLPVTVYEYDNVPGSNGNGGTVPQNFLILAVERRFGGNLRNSARSSVSGWRFSLRSVGATVSNARKLLADSAALLNESRLTVGGESTTRIQYESGQAPAWDDGHYSAVDFYVYAL